MPRQSEKAKLTELLLYKGALDILTARNDRECNEALWDVAVAVNLLESYRYAMPRMSAAPKPKSSQRLTFPQYDESRFKSCLRVSREEFTKILSIIKDDGVFQTKGKVMLPTELQLAIALHRFGSSGSAASYAKVGQRFGVSDSGVIINCTDRVIKALLSLKSKYICWPSTEERRGMVKHMKDKLPGCIGYVGCTHVSLFEAPLNNQESYFSKQQQYGIKVQAICDQQLVLRHILVGCPASIDDASVFASSEIGRSPQSFLSEDQWLAGDSSYKASKYLVTPFCDTATSGTASQRQKFNKYLASHHAKIEQVFGTMMEKFESLKQLRIRVDKKHGHKRACDWISAICVLYNILHSQAESVDPTPDEHPYYTETVKLHGANADGEERQQMLFEWMNKNIFL